MPQSLSAVYLHLVLSTKERRPLLADPVVRADMHAWLGGASTWSLEGNLAPFQKGILPVGPLFWLLTVAATSLSE